MSKSMLEVQPTVVISKSKVGDGNEVHSTDSISGPTEQDIIADKSPTESENELLVKSLRQRFYEQYEEKADPTIVLQIIQRSRNFNEDDFWLCFCLVHPQIAPEVMTLRNELNALYRILGGYGYRKLIYLHQTSINQWRELFLSMSRPNYYSGYSNLSLIKDQIFKAVSVIHKAWHTLEGDLQEVLEPIGEFDGMLGRLNELFEFFQAQVFSIETIIEEEKKRIAQIAREHELLSAGQEDIKAGISKSGSWTSGLGIPLQSTSMRSRSRQRGHDHDGAGPLYQNIYTGPPLHRRIKVRVERHWDRLLKIMGSQKLVLGIVILLAAAGAITTGLATWECLPPDTVPTVDSNFWSTISSSALGIAGLYCTIIPLLRNQEDKVANPRLFRYLLILSMITAVITIICYPFQAQASVVLNYISSVSQLASTLQIIEGAVTKLEYLEEELARSDRR